MTTPTTPLPDLSKSQQYRALGTLFFVVFLNLVGFGIVIPLLPFYGRAFDASAAEVTILFSAYSLGMFISEPFWGRVSDKIGRKPVLLLTLGGNVLAYALLAFASTYESVLGIRLLAGLLAGNIATSQAYVADVSPPDIRARRMGLMGAAFGMGFTLGPALGGFLAAGQTGMDVFMVPMLAASGMSLLAFIATIFILKESNRHMADARDKSKPTVSLLSVIKRHTVGRVIFGTLLMTAGFSAMESSFGLWAEDHLKLGAAEVGFIFSYIGIIVALTQVAIIGPVVKRIGERNTLVTGFAIMTVSLALLPLSPGVWPSLIPTGGIALGMALSSPTINAIISKCSGDHEQGRIIGINMSAGSLSRIFGPVAGGSIYTLMGPGSSFVMASVLMLFAFLAALTLKRVTGSGAQI